MKTLLRLIILPSSAVVLALAALGDDTPKTASDRPDYTRERLTQEQRANRLNGAAKASDLIGMTVKNYQDEKLGKADNLAVDVESGRVVLVILSMGGLAGIGDTLVAVPPGALHHDTVQKVLHLNADKEKLKNAPRFDMSKWTECCNSTVLTEDYRYFGEGPALGFIQHGDVVSNATAERQRNLIPEARLTQVQKANKIIGTSVKNLQGEKLGKVENLLVDLPSGRVVAVVVSSGGFLGLGDELSAVPPTALQFNANRDTLQLDTTKEMLSNAPHFKAHEWPDFAQPTYTAEVYRVYRVEPYFTTIPSTDADNTRRNIRDRDGRTLTPLNQGTSKADLALSADIRKEIVGSKSLSVAARNVKIITVNGRVTLRGSVNTAEEKRVIDDIANRLAGATNVEDQLDVKNE